MLGEIRTWWMAAVAGLVLMVVAIVPASPARAALIGPLPKDPLVYVAMGDSYASGPLVMPHDMRWVSQGCGQSMRNYAHLAQLMIKADVFRDVSCGGATINDFARGQKTTFEPVNAPQFDALNKSVDVITMTIGGNDVGFVGLALDCIRLRQPPDAPSCKSQYVKHGVDQVSKDIKDMGDELALALQHIHVLSPHAAVLVVSYPDAVPNDGKGCWPYIPITDSDMHYLTVKFKEMNAELESTAKDNGAHFVDIYSSGVGHDICQPPGKAWINGIALVPPSFPAHPNDLSFGHSAPIIARAIQRYTHHA